MVYPSFQRRIKCTRIDSGIKSKKSDKGLLTKPDKYINICLNCTRPMCVTGECKVVGGRYDFK